MRFDWSPHTSGILGPGQLPAGNRSASLGLSCSGRSAAVPRPSSERTNAALLPGSTHFASSTISGVPSSNYDLATICTRTPGAQRVASETDSRRGPLRTHSVRSACTRYVPSVDGVVPRLFSRRYVIPRAMQCGYVKRSLMTFPTGLLPASEKNHTTPRDSHLEGMPHFPSPSPNALQARAYDGLADAFKGRTNEELALLTRS